MTRVRPKRAPRRRVAPQETERDWWEQTNHYLAVRSGGRCEIGGELIVPPLTVERHHRQRRRDGGDRLANLMLLCNLHHRHTTEHPAQALANGWIVPVETDPADVPVRLADGYLYTLDDLGGRRLVP